MYTEILAHILSYVLPYTLKPTTSSPSQITWVRGSVAPFLINKAFYNICLALVYGTNTFSIFVSYAAIKFRYTWLVPLSGLRPNVTYNYLTFFSENIRARIRNVSVLVEHVDSYKGMIKYNCGGKGLSEGVRVQVRKFVDEGLLAARRNSPGCGLGKVVVRQLETTKLGKVFVRLEGNKVLDAIRKRQVRSREKFIGDGVGQSVLEPFGELREVGWASVGGSVDSEFATELEKKMMMCREVVEKS